MGLEIIVNENQAKIFARSIYIDISAYIQSHQKEYQEFLLQQEECKNGENKSTYWFKGI